MQRGRTTRIYVEQLVKRYRCSTERVSIYTRSLGFTFLLAKCYTLSLRSVACAESRQKKTLPLAPRGAPTVW